MLVVDLNNANSDKEAARQFRIKLELEAKFQPKIKRLLNKMALEFDNMYRAIGFIIPASSFQDEWKALITKIYVQTSQVFSSDIRGGGMKKKFFEIKQNDIVTSEEDEENIEAEIAAAMAIWIDQASTEQAELITKTNAEQFDKSVDMARRELISKGEQVTDNNVADIATAHLIALALARSELIAMQEVGTAQSEARQVEADVVNSTDAVLAGTVITGRIVKGWNSLLDSRVRPFHVKADSDYRLNPIPTLESFIVGGENLRYPRDANGSAGNIINCRCEAVYSVN
jgi:uncharacterized protein with gpF-like domain